MLTENQDPVQDNLDPNTADGMAEAADAGSTTATMNEPSSVFSWKSQVRSDLRESPLFNKFDDDIDGLNKAMESHANLEKLLGHEKVPIPKGPDDTEGWNRFSKAMGIPDKAEGYGLGDFQLPDVMKGMAIDKNRFSEIAHSLKFTPSQTQNLWKVYNEINVETFNKAIKQHEESMTNTINTLKGEWGDAYETNVELGQTVINKFSDDQDMNDFLTAVLSQDPRGIKFLAKVGNQFAENKMGEFQIKRFSLAPEEAQEEIQKILKDPNHPYNSEKATPKEHRAAVDYVNSLYATINRAKG